MSAPNIKIRCGSCEFRAVLSRRPISLAYQLPSGETLTTGRRFGWCHTCNTVTDIEPDFVEYFDFESRIYDLERKTNNLFSKFLGHNHSQGKSELRDLRLGLKIAKSRNNSPRCLHCGEAGAESLNDYIHTCGGRLIEVDASSDEPRFSYAPTIIYLDYEGRNIQELGLKQVYTNFATSISINGVAKNGLLDGILVYSFFDKSDLDYILENKDNFRKFARIIELRIMHGDFENPLSVQEAQPSPMQKISQDECTRMLLSQNGSLLSKWLKSQVIN